MLWVNFLICAAIIFVAGSKLSMYADTISTRTGFSASAMGVFILAFVTSCPELVTGLTSLTASINAPDLAMGDLLGANIYNIFVIAVFGLIWGNGTLLRGLNKENSLVAALTMIMLAVVALFIMLKTAGDLSPGVFHISLGSVLLALAYIAGTIAVFRHASDHSSAAGNKKSLHGLVIKFVLSSAILVTAGIWLAHTGKAIAGRYNLGEMYVGIILLGFATTMPECVVSFAALRRNAIPMAVGNLLGSNFFNIFIIAILDSCLLKGRIFTYISRLNILPAFISFLLTAVAIIAMRKKPSLSKSGKRASWDSVAILMLFFIGHVLLFKVAK